MANDRNYYIQTRISWLLVVIWMAVIFYLSHQPGTESSELSSGITHLITQTIHFMIPFVDIHMDSLHYYVRKGAHFFAYFTLGLLVVHALYTSRKGGVRGMIYALLICVLYAMSDEVHQLFIPGRSGEMTDVLIDSSGAGIGIIIYGCLARLLKRA